MNQMKHINSTLKLLSLLNTKLRKMRAYSTQLNISMLGVFPQKKVMFWSECTNYKCIVRSLKSFIELYPADRLVLCNTTAFCKVCTLPTYLIPFQILYCIYLLTYLRVEYVVPQCKNLRVFQLLHKAFHNNFFVGKLSHTGQNGL